MDFDADHLKGGLRNECTSLYEDSQIRAYLTNTLKTTPYVPAQSDNVRRFLAGADIDSREEYRDILAFWNELDAGVRGRPSPLDNYLKTELRNNRTTATEDERIYQRLHEIMDGLKGDYSVHSDVREWLGQSEGNRFITGRMYRLVLDFWNSLELIKATEGAQPAEEIADPRMVIELPENITAWLKEDYRRGIVLQLSCQSTDYSKMWFMALRDERDEYTAISHAITPSAAATVLSNTLNRRQNSKRLEELRQQVATHEENAARLRKEIDKLEKSS